MMTGTEIDGSRGFKSSPLQQRGIANREIVARQQRSQLSGAGGSFPNVVPDMLPYFVNYRDDYSATITITNLTKAGRHGRYDGLESGVSDQHLGPYVVVVGLR